MPVRRTRNAGNARSKEQLSREMRHSRLALFIQQFEKEAQERLNELEAKMENMLATVDKVFKVELMKMPPALQNTVTWDLISGETLLIIKLKEFTRSKMSAEIHNLFIFLRPTLLSNRSCSSIVVLSVFSMLSFMQAFTLLLISYRGSTVTSKRTQSRVTKTNDQTLPNKPKLRFKGLHYVTSADVV
uniref:Borealin N-terminal domain-containing protein n=1 Tax=Lates calcarifer TaxID=8187 RepID=A0A4W6EFT6_LATCA